MRIFEVRFARGVARHRLKVCRVEIEHLDNDAIAYRLNGGPRRIISPAPYGIYNVLRQLSAVVDIELRSPEEVESITRLERELHEDLIAYEQERVDRENAVLYASTYPPPLVRERDECGRFRVGPDLDRHVFTRDECVRGFRAALESIQARYPDAINALGVHMSHSFLKHNRREKVT